MLMEQLRAKIGSEHRDGSGGQAYPVRPPAGLPELHLVPLVSACALA